MRIGWLAAGLVLGCFNAANAQSYGGHTYQEWSADHARLTAFAQECQRLTYEHFASVARDAARGIMPSPQPPCSEQMPAVIAQLAQDESSMYNIQHPGAGAQPCNFVAQGCGPVPSSAPSRRGAASSSDPADYDREAIRGEHTYRDGSGQEYVLPNNSGYYFRDPNSGRIYQSDNPDPPNDGRYYDPLN